MTRTTRRRSSRPARTRCTVRRETTFGWRVFEVADIEEARTPSLDDIRETLTDALQLERAFDLLHERAEVFYDERAGNASLEEAGPGERRIGGDGLRYRRAGP